MMPKQHTENPGFRIGLKKRMDFGKSLNLRCPTTAFKDMALYFWDERNRQKTKMANSLGASPNGRCSC